MKRNKEKKDTRRTPKKKPKGKKGEPEESSSSTTNPDAEKQINKDVEESKSDDGRRSNISQTESDKS